MRLPAPLLKPYRSEPQNSSNIMYDVVSRVFFDTKLHILWPPGSFGRLRCTSALWLLAFSEALAWSHEAVMLRPLEAGEASNGNIEAVMFRVLAFDRAFGWSSEAAMLGASDFSVSLGDGGGSIMLGRYALDQVSKTLRLFSRWGRRDR